MENFHSVNDFRNRFMKGGSAEHKYSSLALLRDLRLIPAIGLFRGNRLEPSASTKTKSAICSMAEKGRGKGESLPVVSRVPKHRMGFWDLSIG